MAINNNRLLERLLSFELIPVLMFCTISKDQLQAQILAFPLSSRSCRCPVEFAHATAIHALSAQAKIVSPLAIAQS